VALGSSSLAGEPLYRVSSLIVNPMLMLSCFPAYLFYASFILTVLGEVLELLSRVRNVVHPEGTLLLGIISVTHYEDINHYCLSLIPRWLRERMAQSKGS
jgi:hypothetical protein